MFEWFFTWISQTLHSIKLLMQTINAKYFLLFWQVWISMRISVICDYYFLYLLWQGIRKFPDPWHLIRIVLNNEFGWIFRFYEQYIWKNSPAIKCGATRCNTALLIQPKRNTAVPMYWCMAGEKVVHKTKENKHCVCVCVYTQLYIHRARLAQW